MMSIEDPDYLTADGMEEPKLRRLETHWPGLPGLGNCGLGATYFGGLVYFAASHDVLIQTNDDPTMETVCPPSSTAASS